MKQHRAQSVLGWVTAWEHWVLLSFFIFFIFEKYLCKKCYLCSRSPNMAFNFMPTGYAYFWAYLAQYYKMSLSSKNVPICTKKKISIMFGLLLHKLHFLHINLQKYCEKENQKLKCLCPDLNQDPWDLKVVALPLG